jgi:hypothetical protein
VLLETFQSLLDAPAVVNGADPAMVITAFSVFLGTLLPLRARYRPPGAMREQASRPQLISVRRIEKSEPRSSFPLKNQNADPQEGA